MDKPALEIKLGNAFEKGFIPKNIVKPVDAGPLRVIDKEGEDERITIAFRTLEGGSIHQQQFILSLEEAEALVKEFES